MVARVSVDGILVRSRKAVFVKTDVHGEMAHMASNVERIARYLGITVKDAARLCGEIQEAAPPPVPSSFEVAQAIEERYPRSDGTEVDFGQLKRLVIASRFGQEKQVADADADSAPQAHAAPDAPARVTKVEGDVSEFEGATTTRESREPARDFVTEPGEGETVRPVGTGGTQAAMTGVEASPAELLWPDIEAVFRKILGPEDFSGARVGDGVACDGVEYDGVADVGPDPENAEVCRAYAEMQGDVPCVFVTGKAGTGKSYLLQYFAEKTPKRAVIVAPTGIAALNVGGQTIHSFFRLPPTIINPGDISVMRSAKARELYRRIDTLIIDEVSMLNANVMDAIDQFMRHNGRDNRKPFGGAQVIFFGDLYQLPPVIAGAAESQFFAFHYPSPFFFDAHVFREMPLPVVELQKNYRQTDQVFIEILNEIRAGALSDAHQQLLNGRYDPDFEAPEGELFVTLTTTNATATRINQARLAALPGREYAYAAAIEGEFNQRTLPADTSLRLRCGAQVIFLRNDSAGRWVNGTLGRVTKLTAEAIHVEIVSDGHPYTYRVERETWEQKRYQFSPGTGRISQEVVGKFTQYPLRLAWAMTIHKSQGQTYDHVIIDLTGGAFEHGQVYVALSRCRRLEGIVLKTEIWRNDVLKVNSRILEFSRSGAIWRAE